MKNGNDRKRNPFGKVKLGKLGGDLPRDAGIDALRSARTKTRTMEEDLPALCAQLAEKIETGELNAFSSETVQAAFEVLILKNAAERNLSRQEVQTAAALKEIARARRIAQLEGVLEVAGANRAGHCT